MKRQLSLLNYRLYRLVKAFGGASLYLGVFAIFYNTCEELLPSLSEPVSI